MNRLSAQSLPCLRQRLVSLLTVVSLPLALLLPAQTVAAAAKTTSSSAQSRPDEPVPRPSRQAGMLLAQADTAGNGSAGELMGQAAASFTKGDFNSAIALWTQVILGNPAASLRDEALINRAKAYLVVNQPALALTDLNATNPPLNQPAALANLWMLKGITLLQMRRYSEAVQAFNTSERFDKANAMLYSNRAVAYQSMGNLEAAKKDLIASIKLDPKLSTYYNLAVLQRFSGNNQLCYELLSQIIAKSPTYSQAYLQRGLCAAALKRHEEAIADMLRVLKLDQGNVDAIEQLGLSLAAAGRLQAARTYLLKASSIRLSMGQMDKYQDLLKIIAVLGSKQ